MFKSLLLPVAAVVLPVLVGLASFARPDAERLIGGDTQKKYECVAFCGSAQGCTSAVCAVATASTCSAVVEEASQKCVEDEHGNLLTCTTVPGNDFCFKRLENPCTPQNVVCTQQISGCGRKYNCQ